MTLVRLSLFGCYIFPFVRINHFLFIWISIDSYLALIKSNYKFKTMVKTLSFVDLPGEIRNQVYNQLLLVIVPPPSQRRMPGDPSIYPQILSVCRLVYEEGKQILYGCNTFLAHSNILSGLPRLRPDYTSISSSTLISLIRRYHIQVRLDCDANFQKQKATEAFTGVEDLTIEVFQAQFGSSDYKVLRLFEGIRGVKRARVHGSVQSFPDYVCWLQNAIQTPIGEEIDEFLGEGVVVPQVRSYDIWTVSGDTA